jgi:regulator of protease activity HflC (stomatin/prohibitin superfamily)
VGAKRGERQRQRLGGEPVSGILEWLAKLFDGVTPWVVVRPWERCVRITLGRNVVILDAGFHWRVPIIHEAIIVNTRLRISSVPLQTLTTLDGKTVTIGSQIGYRITDPLAVMQALQQPENSCPALALGAITAYVRSVTAANVTLDGLRDAVSEALEATTDGLAIEFIRVRDFAIVRTYRLMQEHWQAETTVGAQNNY